MSTIYLDMDGVVADFDRAVQAILGGDTRVDQRYPESEWAKLRGHQRIYQDLPLCVDANFLVNGVRALAKEQGLRVLFLTAVPKDNDFPWAFVDKIAWAQRYFPDIPVWFGPYSEDKQIRSRPDDVLIDDRVSNITQWRDQGGYAILYQGQAQPVLDELSLLF
jgi:5'(3')-deoxyribonucleotidase